MRTDTDGSSEFGKGTCMWREKEDRVALAVEFETYEPNGLYATIHYSLPHAWLVVLRINVDLAIFQPYLDLEAEDNQSLKIQVARPGIEPRSSCSASQELNHSATAAPPSTCNQHVLMPPRIITRQNVLHKNKYRYTI